MRQPTRGRGDETTPACGLSARAWRLRTMARVEAVPGESLWA